MRVIHNGSPNFISGVRRLQVQNRQSSGVVAPLLQAVAHGEHLALKSGAGVANDHVHAQRQPVRQGQVAVFARHQQAATSRQVRLKGIIFMLMRWLSCTN
jgi:hypothetical protein